jgi:Kdo2-lipid IVA lauroyltransferase/acyltransferase
LAEKLFTKRNDNFEVRKNALMIILNRLFYYGFILPLSRLPFSILYVISDGLFYVIYHLIGYRKKVVFTNIRNSFPEKTDKEHQKIASEYYRHLCDLVLESLKVFSITESEVKERMKVMHADVPDRYFEQGRSIIVAGGHYNNWELFAVAIDQAIKHSSLAIYKPLTNTYFDAIMQRTRSKYGLRLIHNRKVKETFEEQRNNLTATIFAIDQAPSPHATPHWTTFLNQETGVLMGAEKYARLYNYPVVFCQIHKLSRGHYAFEFEPLCEEPNQMKDGEITERVTRRLEEYINKDPRYWLWSHRRWKYPRSSYSAGN